MSSSLSSCYFERERHFFTLFSIESISYFWPRCVQTWLCGRSAIRCAPLTAQIIAIHHLFTLSFGKSGCFTPWNYNLSPRSRKVSVSWVSSFLFVLRIHLWSVARFGWYADGCSLFCLWFTPSLFLFVKMWRWKGDARMAGGSCQCKSTVGLMLQGETFDVANDLCHWKCSQTQAQVHICKKKKRKNTLKRVSSLNILVQKYDKLRKLSAQCCLQYYLKYRNTCESKVK